MNNEQGFLNSEVNNSQNRHSLFLVRYSDGPPRVKIDYVLYRSANKWRVLETKVICNEKVVDHCMMLSVLELLEA